MKILLIRAKDIFGGNFMSIIMLAEDLSSHVKKN